MLVAPSCSVRAAHEESVVGLCTTFQYTAVTSTAAAAAAATAGATQQASSKDARVFSAGGDNVLKCWDGFDMSELFRFAEKKGDVCCLLYVHTAELLAAGLEDGSILFWNPDSKR